jgi:uncharacterized cupredoxin-like copper-binding protein
MKRIVLPSVIVVIALFLAACGNSAPAAQASPQAAPTTASATQSGSTSGGVTEVDVTLADNTITSSLTAFKVGEPYKFVILNNGHHAHNFNIAPPVSVSGSLDTSLAQALLAVKQDKLPVGGGTTVEFTFPDSAVGQQLEFSCLIPRHYEDGMKLAISVTN